MASWCFSVLKRCRGKKWQICKHIPLSFYYAIPSRVSIYAPTLEITTKFCPKWLGYSPISETICSKQPSFNWVQLKAAQMRCYHYPTHLSHMYFLASTVAFSIPAFKCKRWDFKRNASSSRNSFCKPCQLVFQRLTFYLLYPELFFCIELKVLLSWPPKGITAEQWWYCETQA